jgi:DNA-binding NarL/FixJ family response regulator
MTDVRVLVVDGEAPLLRTMSAVVEEADGFEVIGEAASGEQCLVAAAQLLPDLVLIGIDLPGMDGVEASSRLRARPSSPVVLLVSTCHEDAGARLVPWCGAAAYVAKAAFGPDRLRAVWETASGRTAAPAPSPVSGPRRTRSPGCSGA